MTDTERKDPDYRATLNIRMHDLRLWLSPNFFGHRKCKSMDEARKLIADSGVPSQRLEVE
jgi:hypothetical protein